MLTAVESGELAVEVLLRCWCCDVDNIINNVDSLLTW